MRVKTLLMIAVAATVSAAPALAQTATAPAAAAAPAAASAPADAGAATASASATATVTKGATIYDVSGGVVGTVESVEGDLAVVSTGKNKARLPLSSFAAGEKGPVLGMTRDELDAAASAASGSAKTNAAASTKTTAPKAK